MGLDASDRAILDKFEAAVDSHTEVEFDYADQESRKTRRNVRPLGLYFWGKTWTLAAWCLLREDFRSFRVDRITDFTLGAPFRPERGKLLADYYAYQMRNSRR
jgi:predicted DNA-binding transcriptional regulator YafY